MSDPESIAGRREEAAQALVHAVVDQAVAAAVEQLRVQAASMRIVGGRVTLLDIAVDPATRLHRSATDRSSLVPR